MIRYAVEVETAAPLSAAWKTGVPEEVEYTPSFVDGIGSGSVLPQMVIISVILNVVFDGNLIGSLKMQRRFLME